MWSTNIWPNSVEFVEYSAWVFGSWWHNLAELASKFAWVGWKNLYELGSKNKKPEHDHWA